jgi:hypothetical protein
MYPFPKKTCDKVTECRFFYGFLLTHPCPPLFTREGNLKAGNELSSLSDTRSRLELVLKQVQDLHKRGREEGTYG